MCNKLPNSLLAARRWIFVVFADVGSVGKRRGGSRGHSIPTPPGSARGLWVRGRGLWIVRFFYSYNAAGFLFCGRSGTRPGPKNLFLGCSYQPGTVVYSGDDFFENGWGYPLTITDNF